MLNKVNLKLVYPFNVFQMQGTYRVYRVIASTEGVKGPTESFFWHSEMGGKGK